MMNEGSHSIDKNNTSNTVSRVSQLIALTSVLIGKDFHSCGILVLYIYHFSDKNNKVIVHG